MTLAMTLLVRDEEDVLEDTLRYHLAQGVDVVIAMDNGSRDATPEILRTFQSEGSLRVVECPAPSEYRQAEWVTEMARLAAREYRADWVINADADEFWWPLAGSLADVLGAVPAECDVVEVPRSDFLPAAEGQAPFHQRLLIREAHTISPTGWPLLPKVAHRGHPEVAVAVGNHSVTAPWTRSVSSQGRLEIFHFPMRDYGQFERKVINAGEAFARTPTVPLDSALDQRALYELHLQGRLREYYDAKLPDEKTLEAGLAEGDLVVDRRLMTFLADGSAAGGRPGSAEAEAIRAVTSAALGFATGARQACDC
jgi:hypothetical protein